MSEAMPAMPAYYTIFMLGVSIDVTISLDGISGSMGKCKMLIIKKQEVANRRDGAFGL